MKLIGVFLALLLTSTAFANFTGHWTGVGSAQDSAGWSSSCNVMSFKLSHTSYYLEIISGKYNCGGFRSEMNSTRAEIVGEELWYAGNKIGSITANTIKAQIGAPQSQLIQYFDLSLNNDTLTYQEEISYLDNGNVYSVLVDGQLSR